MTSRIPLLDARLAAMGVNAQIAIQVFALLSAVDQHDNAVLKDALRA